MGVPVVLPDILEAEEGDDEALVELADGGGLGEVVPVGDAGPDHLLVPAPQPLLIPNSGRKPKAN